MMFLHTIPTFHFHKSGFKTDLHFQAFTITATSTNHAALRNAIAHDYVPKSHSRAKDDSSIGRSPVPWKRGKLTGSRRVLRSNSLTAVDSATVELESALSVVRKYYDAINRRDLVSVEDLIALNCVYEDLVFPRPFVGRKAILDFLKQFINSISTDLKFAIDDISEEDTSVVGVTWHLDMKGKPFPFTKGCSFYRLDVVNGQRQIVYGRDCVEPAIKTGETTFAAIRGVTWLLEKFPFLADLL